MKKIGDTHQKFLFFKKFLLLLLMLLVPTILWGQDAGAAADAAGSEEASGLDKGDTAWMIVASTYVFFMLPGLALFYGGIVRAKNVLSTMMHTFAAVLVLTIHWTVFGYSFSTTGESPYFGGLDKLFMSGVTADSMSDSIPELVYFVFQGTFALITPAIISGSLAERVKFSSYILFLILWSTLVYNPVWHWVWSESGWIAGLGAIDFAGGTVVHLISGIAGLAVALVIGKRKGEITTLLKPNNLTLTLLGAGILWFGWFGFNAGSGLVTDGVAGRALAVTFIAPAAAGTMWMLVEWLHTKKATALGAASGIVAGLVVITPAAGTTNPDGALIMGLIVSPLCYAAILLKNKLGYDDTLDAFGIHGVGGAIGAILTGVFAVELAEGISSRGEQIWVQFISVVATGIYSFVLSYAIAFIIEKTVGFRVNEETEIAGLDSEIHGERGYNIT